MASNTLVPSRRSTLLTDLRTRDEVAERAQGHDAAAKQLAALQAARQDLINKGVMPSALPEVTASMSPTDRAALATRMAGMAQAHAAGQASRPAATATAAADPAKGQAAMDGARAKLGIPPVTRKPIDTPLTPATQPTPAPSATKTPLETALSTVPNHQGLTVDARQTGAGMVATVPGVVGPRSVGAREVGVNPTFEQVMHAKTGGAWATMTPQQRAGWLRSNPATNPMNPGEVIDSGKSPTDYRGVTTIQTPNGVVQENDLSKDQLYSKDGVTSLENGLRGIEGRYGGKRAIVKAAKAPAATTTVPPATVAQTPPGQTSEMEHADPATTGAGDTTEMEHADAATTGTGVTPLPPSPLTPYQAGAGVRALPSVAGAAGQAAVSAVVNKAGELDDANAARVNPIIQGAKDFVNGITGRPPTPPPAAAPIVTPDQAGAAVGSVASVGGAAANNPGQASVTPQAPTTPGLPQPGFDENGNMIRKPVFPGTAESTFAQKPEDKPAVPSAVDDRTGEMGDFLQNEHDDQFKKGLKFQGFNDGI